MPTTSKFFQQKWRSRSEKQSISRHSR